MKARRLLSLLLLLQAAGRKSARELARELEVSQRTVLRDIEALAQAGVPVYAERGVNGGMVLAEGYRRALTQLGEDDLRSLMVTTTDPLADLGFAPRRARVLDQLLGALPPEARRSAEQARKRVLVDQSRWYQSEQPSEVLAALREAAWGDRRVEVDYQDRRGNARRRVLDPLGLVSKAGVWYLVARSEGEYKTFRADRVAEVTILKEHYTRPADFDLEAYWRSSAQRMESGALHYWLTVRVAPHLLPDIFRFMEHVIVDRDGGVVKINFASASDAAWRILVWQSDAEVLEPQSFIDDLVKRSRAVVERYGKRAETRDPSLESNAP